MLEPFLGTNDTRTALAQRTKRAFIVEYEVSVLHKARQQTPSEA